jgi:signal transduction histidine kinase
VERVNTAASEQDPPGDDRPPLRRHRYGLRVRAAAAMALGGLVVSVTLGLLAYELSRTYLLDKRGDLVRQEAFLNAGLAVSLPQDDTGELPGALEAIGGVDKPALLRVGDQWYGSVVGVGPQAVPAELLAIVERGEPGYAVTRIDGAPAAVVGVPLPGGERSFFQVFPVVELAATLDSIRNALVVAAVVTTLGSAAYGLFMSRRVLRPLRDTTTAARRIADGDLSTRLADVGDPDLSPLVAGFNDMAAALQERIERERRFAADVSHELRTPLTALNSAVRIVDRRVGDLDVDGRSAVEVLQSQLDHFSRLVLEILDLSRLESGTADVRAELVELRPMIAGLARDTQLDDARVVIGAGVPERVAVDPRRLRIVVRNLVENAANYAGGCTRLCVSAAGDRWVLEVDDAGPGVDPAERSRIFERFHRGSAGTLDGAATGTGLGLSLVDESVRAMGGSVEVGESSEGGARFRVELPVRSDLAVGDEPPHLLAGTGESDGHGDGDQDGSGAATTTAVVR